MRSLRSSRRRPSGSLMSLSCSLFVDTRGLPGVRPSVGFRSLGVISHELGRRRLKGQLVGMLLKVFEQSAFTVRKLPNHGFPDPK